MFSKIKRFIFDKEVKKIERLRGFRSWSSIKSVLIVFESEHQEKNNNIKALIKMMQDEGKRVVAIGYVDKKIALSASLDSYIMLDKSSLDILGRPKHEFIASKIDDEFDVVIDLTITPCLPLMYILIWANTSMRCGKRDERMNLFDFVIDMPAPPVSEETGMVSLSYSEEWELGSQIIKYLKKIN